MTYFKFVTRASGESIQDNEENLLRYKGLIIPLESLKYCEKNKIDRIRHKVLKSLSNNKLASLTGGRETDFGGSFDKYIVKFESMDDSSNRLLERYKKSHKESYIIPNVQNIRNLLAKKGLSNLIDNEPTSWKEVKPNKSKNVNLGCIEVTGIIPDAGDEMPKLIEHKLYNVSYYYENGRPVFVRDINGWEKDPAPFYGDDDTKYKVTEHMNTDRDMKASPIFISDPWKIHLIQPKQKNILLKDEIIKQLLSIGENIVLCNPTTHLGIAIDYNSPHEKR